MSKNKKRLTRKALNKLIEDVHSQLMNAHTFINFLGELIEKRTGDNSQDIRKKYLEWLKEKGIGYDDQSPSN